MVERRSHWTHAGLIFLLTLLATGVLLPLVRVQPESVHRYLNGLNDWVRISVAFALCVMFTRVMFKLLLPRVGHLTHWKAYPPAWLAALLASIVAAIVDIFGGFDTCGYRASAWEWLGYAGGSLLIVGWYSGLWSEIVRQFQTPKKEQVDATKSITLQDIENAPWEEIEAWLKSDAPARYDFLGNRSVADRVSLLVSQGTRSVGIVGPYGAGKTSIIGWVTDELKRQQVGGRQFFICHHSCWGFETSASAIHDMLGSAISKLGAEIDTFQVDSLPESYRQTFSAGGDWVETIWNLVLRNPKPMEQFSRLSDLLGHIGGRLIFIVEDLDRNETSNFEIQEVLAFLERIKSCPNLSFILTGGLSSTLSIDYPKLCDHIDYLKSVETEQSSKLITRVCERCLDLTIFPHVPLDDTDRKHVWNPVSGSLMRDYDELSLPQAIASLLNTPRSLRHALGHSFNSWHTLRGEIDLNHLVAMNVLRFGAREAFSFLMRRWDRVHVAPSKNPSFGKEQLEKITKAVIDDWNRTIENVDWNPTAARMVMEHILPTIGDWFGNQPRSREESFQSVDRARYWRRAINECLDASEIRDQEVIRDVKAWLDAPGVGTELVTKLTSLPRYCDVWENFADGFFANRRDQILPLCEQIIHRILKEQGSSAGWNSQGFIEAVRFAKRVAKSGVSLQPENLAWLKDRISEAGWVSIKMVTGLWQWFGISDEHSILRIEDREPVRQHILATAKACLTSGTTLIDRLCPNDSATLLRLVFHSGNSGSDGKQILADVQSWSWLGIHILDALRNGDLLAAANCGELLGYRVSGREQMKVDVKVLDQFFGDDAREVIDILDSMIDQFPRSEQTLIRNVIGAARQHLDGGTLPDTQEGETDAN